jgi:hypothetical protein
MRLPGFTAEASVGSASVQYGYEMVQDRSGPAVVAAIIGRLPVIRCCRWAPGFGRFVCTSRTRLPGESCECHSGVYGPIITCRDNGITFQRLEA